MELQTFPSKRTWSHTQPFWFYDENDTKIDTKIVTWSLNGEFDLSVIETLVDHFYKGIKVINLKYGESSVDNLYLKFHPMPSLSETLARDFLFRYWELSGNSLENVFCKVDVLEIKEPEDLTTDNLLFPIIDFGGFSHVLPLKINFRPDFAPSQCPSCQHAIKTVWKFFGFLANCAVGFEKGRFDNSFRMVFNDTDTPEETLGVAIERYRATFEAAKIESIHMNDGPDRAIIWEA